MVKKILCLLLAASALCLCLVSCTDKMRSGDSSQRNMPSQTEIVPTDAEGGGFSPTVPEIPQASLPEILDREACLVARLVSAEAGGEPYMTQVCVAALIFNRMKSPAFPDTVEGVVFEPFAFDTVSAGLVTSSGEGEDTSSESYNVSLRAVMEAAKGRDPTGGAVYFDRKDNVRSYVLPSYECGNMVFGI